MKKTLSAVLSALIVLLSAGLTPYAAAAAEFAAPRASASPKALGALALPSVALPQVPPSLNGPSITLGLSAAATRTAAPSSIAAPERAALQVQGKAAAVSQTLRSYEAAQNVSGESASRAGQAVTDAITGAASDDDGLPLNAAVSSDFGLSFAKPAGAEIRDAAEAFHQEAAPQPPAPPQTPTGNQGSGGGDGEGPKGAPLAAKIGSAVIALAPAALLGLPLLHAGATIVAGLVAAASVGIAASAFMTARTPRLLRSLPGVAIIAGGVLLTAFGVAIGPLGLHAGASLILPGLITTAGGWGLVRFGRNDSKWQYAEPSETIATYIGALAAATGIGLGFSLLAGPLATVGTVATSIGTVALFTQLPGWIGSAVERAAYGVYLSVGQAYRVATSVRRDTTLYKRLSAISETYVRKSVWNLAWLGLFVWLPLVAAETVSTVLGTAFGLAHGLIRAPFMALWGASYSLRPKSRFTQALSYMGRTMFAYNKPVTFNNAEKLLLPWANSKNPLKNAAAVLGIRAMQLIWLSLGVLALASFGIVGWEQATAQSKKAHDAALDDPGNVKIPQDLLPSQVPDVEKPASVPSPTLARILAAAIGLVPLVFLAMPLFMGGHKFGAMVAGASLLIALMPLIPAKHGGAASLAGWLLAVSGLVSAGVAAGFLVMGLPVGAIVGMGLAAFFGGFGLHQLVKKLRKEDGSAYDTDSPLYALGFVGALAVSAGLDASLLGKGGMLAHSLYAVGGLGGLTLSFFLPKYLWQGLGDTVKGAGYSISSQYKALSFWHDKTDFGRNLTSYLNGIVKKWWAAGALLVAVPYIALGAIRLAEAATAVILGAASGIYQAPARFLWGAAYHANPDGRVTRFLAGFNRSLTHGVEGKGPGFSDGLAKMFGKAMSQAAPSRRPTLRAWLAALAAAAFTAMWVAGSLLTLSPLYWAGAAAGLLPALSMGLPFGLVAAVMGGTLLIIGVIDGVRNARGAKTQMPSYQDPDNPDFTWSRREAK